MTVEAMSNLSFGMTSSLDISPYLILFIIPVLNRDRVVTNAAK